jgi:aspartate-semialdehyde dehydrogenase
MPPSNGQPLRIGIVGASTLRGKEIAEILDRRPPRRPIAEVRLFDDLSFAGTLTAVAGEPVVVQNLSEDSFRGLEVVFFACEESFSSLHWPAAERAGAVVIDLSGALAKHPSAVFSIPTLESAHTSPDSSSAKLFYSPGAAAIVACTAAAALRALQVRRMAAVLLQPVSEQGTAGIEELENQTVKLLSFQPFAREVFDTQVAFNLVDRFGESSRESLENKRGALARDVQAYLRGTRPLPAVQLVHAPVFYSLAYSIYVELEQPSAPEALASALTAVGVSIPTAEDPPACNLSVAGSDGVTVGSIRRDANLDSGYWLWGAVDNIRLAADNAVRIAEKILEVL